MSFVGFFIFIEYEMMTMTRNELLTDKDVLEMIHRIELNIQRIADTQERLSEIIHDVTDRHDAAIHSVEKKTNEMDSRLRTLEETHLITNWWSRNWPRVLAAAVVFDIVINFEKLTNIIRHLR